MDERLRQFVENTSIQYISQIDNYDMQYPEDFMSHDSWFWADGNHLSRDGEMAMGERFDLLAEARLRLSKVL